eukprot:11208400-Alexandrium_andersonii.AAC.1
MRFGAVAPASVGNPLVGPPPIAPVFAPPELAGPCPRSLAPKLATWAPGALARAGLAHRPPSPLNFGPGTVQPLMCPTRGSAGYAAAQHPLSASYPSAVFNARVRRRTCQPHPRRATLPFLVGRPCAACKYRH